MATKTTAASAPSAAPVAASAPVASTTTKASAKADDAEAPALTNKQKIEGAVQAQADLKKALAKPADIDPATVDNMGASGAFIEPGAVAHIDVDHPAVDNNPRSTTTEVQNRIDFNDPDKNDAQAVSDNLNK